MGHPRTITLPRPTSPQQPPHRDMVISIMITLGQLLGPCGFVPGHWNDWRCGFSTWSTYHPVHSLVRVWSAMVWPRNATETRATSTHGPQPKPRVFTSFVGPLVYRGRIEQLTFEVWSLPYSGQNGVRWFVTVVPRCRVPCHAHRTLYWGIKSAGLKLGRSMSRTEVRWECEGTLNMYACGWTVNSNGWLILNDNKQLNEKHNIAMQRVAILNSSKRKAKPTRKW
jgi:hypothetical protein